MIGRQKGSVEDVGEFLSSPVSVKEILDMFIMSYGSPRQGIRLVFGKVQRTIPTIVLPNNDIGVRWIVMERFIQQVTLGVMISLLGNVQNDH